MKIEEARVLEAFDRSRFRELLINELHFVSRSGSGSGGSLLKIAAKTLVEQMKIYSRRRAETQSERRTAACYPIANHVIRFPSDKTYL